MKGPVNVIKEGIETDTLYETPHLTSGMKPQFIGDKESESGDSSFDKQKNNLEKRKIILLTEWDEIEAEKSKLPCLVNSIGHVLNSGKFEYNLAEDVFLEPSYELFSSSKSSKAVTEGEEIESQYVWPLDISNMTVEDKNMKEDHTDSSSKTLSMLKYEYENFGKEEQVVEHMTMPKVIPVVKAKNVKIGNLSFQGENTQPRNFIVKNDKNSKPFIVVKNLPLQKDKSAAEQIKIDKVESLKNKKTIKQKIVQCLDQKLGNKRKLISNQKPNIPSVVPKSDKCGVTSKTKEDKELSNGQESQDLMWLLNFKLDNIFTKSVDGGSTEKLRGGGELPNKKNAEIGCQTENKSGKLANKQSRTKQPTDPLDTGTGRTFHDQQYTDNKKPPFTYTELIECALQEKGPLTVSEIYQWISETFPYYKSWDDRWKNSVRHNLSINPYFRKGTKARQGSGHLWTVNKSDDSLKMNNWKRQRMQEFEEFHKKMKMEAEKESNKNTVDSAKEENSQVIYMDETELATASIEDKENRRLHRHVLMTSCVDCTMFQPTCISLEQSAEEILKGVKRNVEVQYLEPVNSSCNENDFLNPISKEELMGECGLLTPIELTLSTDAASEHSAEIITNISETEITTEHILGLSDDLSFHYGDITATSSLLSLVN